ncbi:MAG TPA: PaaX family transcriptional regulator C-terminal domain-containing protein, partial [Pseudonocardiaceae bacterium]|nr:PaaX family transcriptional regulator C-terminal domain-containing protein [Pseudonocardiaceae bacterium]
MSLTTADDTPTLSRRHAAGAESARGLLLTVLGEFVLPAGGAAWTSTFIDVLGRLGIEEKASRQALMRTAAAGWLTSQRLGRRTLWTLSPSAEQMLTDGTARIYGFQGTQPEWDGRWLLVLARVPETDRPARHLLRTRLTWAGFGSPAPGVWISTHPERADEVDSVLAEVGLADEAQMFVASHSGGELPTMVRQAWDLDAVEQAYEEFLAEFDGQPTRDPLAQLVQLVHAWRRFPTADPELPADLLPARWSGARAAAVFQRQHALWTDQA